MNTETIQHGGNYGTTDGVIKPLQEVLLADPRMKFLSIYSKAGERLFTLDDLYLRVNSITVAPSAPDDVRLQFDVARNAMLYNWFVFEFQTLAELQAYSTLELALRTKFPDAKRLIKVKGQKVLVPETLAPLLRRAIQSHLIVPEELPTWQMILDRRAREGHDSASSMLPQASATEWLQNLTESLPGLRNSLAHGNLKLDIFSSLFSLQLCADLINSIFKPILSEQPSP